ncbi:hypothetical protein C8Q75DRAFT_770926 [Abortiporus biennis]|nr:hypothetical protein C8Q75DRAFT_770926 [Abortiporus biennis]
MYFKWLQLDSTIMTYFRNQKIALSLYKMSLRWMRAFVLSCISGVEISRIPLYEIWPSKSLSTEYNRLLDYHPNCTTVSELWSFFNIKTTKHLILLCRVSCLPSKTSPKNTRTC